MPMGGGGISPHPGGKLSPRWKFFVLQTPPSQISQNFLGGFLPPSISPPPPAEVLRPHQGLEKVTPPPPGKKLGPLKISGSLGMYDDNGIL